MKIKAVYTVSFRITDYDLFEELDSNESAWVDFLTAILDSIRFSEDFTKKWVSTEGDELFWNDDEDYGEAQVIVTVEDNYDGSNEWWNDLLPEIKEIWSLQINTTAETFTLDDYATVIAQGGAFWNIVNWGSMIKVDDDSEGCLFESDEDLRDMYINRIHNIEGGLNLISGEFTDSNGIKYELNDWVASKDEVLNSIEKCTNDSN
jgi:hypothetical protein